MTDPWIDRLSDYLDNELSAAERAELEAHLLHCVSCGAALADLRRVVGLARALPDREPKADLWPAIASAIGATPAVAGASPRGGRARRWSFSLPQLVAASIALMLLSAGGAWLLHPSAVGRTGPLASSTPAVVPVLASAEDRSYDAAVAELERVLAQGRGRLDSTTVRVLEQNLALIDQAIAQAQRAVAADSANVYLNSHLAATMRQKLELLRKAAALASAAS